MKRKRGRPKKKADPEINPSEVEAMNDFLKNTPMPSQRGKIIGISEPEYANQRARAENHMYYAGSNQATEDAPKVYREATTREKLELRIRDNENRMMDLQIETEKLAKLLHRLDQNKDLELLINIQQGVY